MTISIRTQITDELITILKGIKSSSGYRTNIGKNVYCAIDRGGSEEADCIYLVPGEETVEIEYGVMVTEITYEINGIVDSNITSITDFSNPRAPWVLVDGVIEDIRTALESQNTDLESLITGINYISTLPEYPADGGTICGASMTFRIRYSSERGSPDTIPT